MGWLKREKYVSWFGQGAINVKKTNHSLGHYFIDPEIFIKLI
jgi:hypothetical protein